VKKKSGSFGFLGEAICKEALLVTPPSDKMSLSSGSRRRVFDEVRIYKYTHIQAEFKCSESLNIINWLTPASDFSIIGYSNK
jgi:hypothetical protein